MPTWVSHARDMPGMHPVITLCERLEFLAFVAAMKRATLILTDSGGVQEEAPALGKPVLVMRHGTERPEGVDEGVAKRVGPTRGAIGMAARRLLEDRSEEHTSELQSPMRTAYAVFSLKKKKTRTEKKET